MKLHWKNLSTSGYVAILELLHVLKKHETCHLYTTTPSKWKVLTENLSGKVIKTENNIAPKDSNTAEKVERKPLL